MKKVLSILLALMMIFGALSAVSFAEDSKSYTENFIEDIKDGFAVNIDGQIKGNIAIKGENAAFGISIFGLNAKAIMKDGKTVAYISPFFKADVTDIIKDLMGDIKISDIISVTDMISEYTGIFEYTKVNATVSGNNITEVFTPDVEKFADELKALAASKVENDELKQMIMAFNTQEFIAYCENLPDGEDNGKLEFTNAMKCGAKVSFTDKGKTVTDFEITIPSEDFKSVSSITLADINLSGIEIKSISADVDDSAFNATGIFNITWLVKLLAKYVISSIG